MTSDSKPHVPFSQRTGLEPIPPQLKLGEVSAELRRLLYYYISLEIGRVSYTPFDTAVFEAEWRRVAMDLHVLFFKQSADNFDYSAYRNQQHLNVFIQRAKIGELFDLVEFFVRHPNCGSELKRELADAFVMARAAYRVFDNKYIAAIGTEEQAAAFERAIADAEAPPHASSSSRRAWRFGIRIGRVACARASTPSRRWRCASRRAQSP